MAAAKKSMFFCKECGYDSAKWFGQCPACRQWNTAVEEMVSKKAPAGAKSLANRAVLTRINDITVENEDRTSTGFGELDRVLGGGIVKGSLVLVGGDPGIGKSTLLLQMCHKLTNQERNVLYVSGEESLKQIKMRADRIGHFTDKLQLFCETNLDAIEETIKNVLPEVVIIDSIQTMFREGTDSAPGSVTQVREATSTLLQLAKGLGIAIFIVGHVTKEGVVAGPRVLEHMVDTVLYFEGDRHAAYRILRAVKNRFGSTNEIGMFEMQEVGLVEVLNASEYMLNGRPQNAPGSVVACLMEGTRPIMVEIQALVSHTNFNLPRRTTVGADINRANLLMAVLEKRLGLKLYEYDAYVNVAGGLRINEPAIDLGIVLAILSNYKNQAMGSGTIVFGEVGLTGEVRAVSQVQQRVLEAIKLGFDTCIIPQVCVTQVKKLADQIRIIGVSNIVELASIK
jgi:DNA repair protein RadA/Sms